MLKEFKNFAKNLVFPKFCLNCGKEEEYLCDDCLELLEVSGFHQISYFQNLNDLYFAVDYKNSLVKKLIQAFKYQTFAKELNSALCCLIIKHFQLMDNKPDFSGFILIPVPLYEKRLRWRGFNQAEILAQGMAQFFKIPLALDYLTRIKKTFPQIELSVQARKENVKNAFSIKNKKLVKNKNIILIDDVYTSGATIQECARVLKKAGAKKVIGITIARG